MNCFELIPSELNNIIISYLEIDEIETLLNVFNIINVNWNTIHVYHFGVYPSNRQQINKQEYLSRLEAEILINKLDLRFNVDDLLNLKLLNLYNYDIREIPKEMGILTNLTTLDLGSNKIVQIPIDDFGQLTNLKMLDLSDNKINQISSDLLGKLTNLTTLDLSWNYIEEIPEAISILINLEILNLNGNNIKRVPNDLFNKLTNLQELYLENNDITQISDELFDKLKNIKHFNL